MHLLWRYIQVKEHREFLTFICGGLAALIMGSWAVYTHFSKKEAEEKAQLTITAPGGVAANSITGSPITISPPAPAAASR